MAQLMMHWARGRMVIISDMCSRYAMVDCPDAETKLIAQEQDTHLLDLHAASIEYVEAIGPDAAHRLNRLPDDNTRKLLPGIYRGLYSSWPFRS